MISNKYSKIIITTMLALIAYKAFAFFNSPSPALSFENASKSIAVNDNGLIYSTTSQVDTVGDFLKEKNLTLGEHDQLIPDKNSSLLPDMNIDIRRAKEIKILVDGKTIANWTLGQTVSQALAENNVTLFRLDKTDPDLDAPIGDDA
ncbi:MAG: ubiquitin-like domain-containing protein, partial [Candidatus Pacebacteria bacterium]|nr:ubiquitin-like domain-containing protein [Candidatus Paceibacterota bacterium]